ncbi:MAG: hypothetical protein MJ210_03750 [Alphaproteobacteria bacterium]|nr:hypothetical protein [Alphaproteobacteria bacterium]
MKKEATSNSDIKIKIMSDKEKKERKIDFSSFEDRMLARIAKVRGEKGEENNIWARNGKTYQRA